MTRRRYGWSIALMLFAAAGCSIRQAAIREMTHMAGAGMAAYEQDTNIDLVVKSLPANIKLFEVMLESDLENAGLMVLLSRMYGGYGFIYYETCLEALTLDVDRVDGVADYFNGKTVSRTRERLTSLYLKGAAYGLKALSQTHPNAEDKMKNVAAMDAFLASLKKKDVPALFWYGFNLGGYVNLKRDDVDALAKLVLVEKIMQRVAELDPAYFNGGAHLFLSGFYAARSPMMGGRPSSAKAHYQALKDQVGNGFLLADLFYARFYLYRQQDRDGFVQVLTRIKNEKGDDRYALYNQVARDRANIYLKAEDDLFF